MSENIENVIWYSIGAFDYFIERKDILSNDEKGLINNCISSFGYIDEELTVKRSEIKKNFVGRCIYQEQNQFDLKHAKQFTSLYKTDSLDNYISDISKKIEDKKVISTKESLKQTLVDLESFSTIHLIEGLTTKEIFSYQVKAVNLLNNIIDLDEDNFYDVDDVKQKLYPLIRNSIFQVFNENFNKKCLIKLLKTFEILDLFTIFNWNLQVFPITLVEYLLEELISDNKREKWPVNRYHCMKMFLLENINPLDEEYLEIYENYFKIESDNAYLIMALRAQYLDNIVVCKKMFSKIDGNNLNDFFYNYFEDLEIALKGSDDKNFKTVKNTDEMLSILDLKDTVALDKYLREFDTSMLSSYCLNESTRCLLSRSTYNVIESEAILYKNASSLYSYFSKSSEYIAEEDIASLYIFSTILLNLNLINESYVLLKRIIERVDCENKKVLDTLNLQLLITKKFLGYIV